jgi:hypothetical protein
MDDYSLPFTRISPLLPQLNSLTISNGAPDAIAQCVTLSTSLKLLSLPLHAIAFLNSDTQAIIRETMEVLRIVIHDVLGIDEQTALSAIIRGSRIMKKVILDGSKFLPHSGPVDTLTRILVPVCEKAEVELWRGKFKVGNGKVDLDSE